MTLDPSDWYLYALARTLDRTLEGTKVTTNWGDFDHLAVVDNVLVISMDMVSFKDGSQQGGKVRLLDKSELINGRPVTTWIDFVGLRNATLSTITFGSPGVVFLVWQSPCEVQVLGISNPLSSPTLASHTLLPAGLPCPPAPPDAAQPGGGKPLDIMPKIQPVYRNGSLWAAIPAGKNFGSGEVSAIRWTQIDVSAWPDAVSLVQHGTFGADGIWHFAPAIMVDASNNFAMVYARSSPTEFASAYYTGRLATDPPNTLRPGKLLKAGTATLNLIDTFNPGMRNRFTDYFGIALDPIDESFWMMGMYAKAPTMSGTWVGNVVPVAQQAGIMAAFESPEAGPVSGVTVIRGWAFAIQAGVQIGSIELFIDGVSAGDIPCCSPRGDVQAAFPDNPNALNSGWGTTFNWGVLNAGIHKVQVVTRNTTGEQLATETRTVTVVKPGNFAFLDQFSLSAATARIEGDQLIVEGAVVRDKASQQQKQITARYRWFTSSQSLQTVEAVTTATISSLRSFLTEMFAFLSARLMGLPVATNAQASPGIVRSFESPEANQVVSGVGVIRGWAFTDTAGATLNEVRLVIDGMPSSSIPCCSQRGDVAAAYPGNPNALNSGWGFTINYGNFSAGFHNIGIRFGDSVGASVTDTHGVTVVRIGGFEFLDQFDLAGATARIEGEEIVVSGVRVRDKVTRQTRVVTVRLRWFQSSQFLGITSSVMTGSSPSFIFEIEATVSAAAEGVLKDGLTMASRYLQSNLGANVHGQVAVYTYTTLDKLLEIYAEHFNIPVEVARQHWLGGEKEANAGQSLQTGQFVIFFYPLGRSWVTSPTAIRIGIVFHEYFHIFQRDLHRRGPDPENTISPTGPGPRWLEEGSAAYFQHKFLDASGLLNYKRPAPASLLQRGGRPHHCHPWRRGMVW
jgi:hypothetical protein